MTTRVHVTGAAGYAAAEALRWLHGHPLVEVGVVESRSHAGVRLGDHFPLLRDTPYRCAEAGSVLAAARPGDVAIVGGTDDESRAIVPSLLEAGARTIDLSAQYRADASAAYGLCEWERDAIAGARLVANPGCYPTAALLALLPLASLGNPRQIVIDAKSGITGAGRRPRVESLFAEVTGEIRAYGLEGHRHQPEIERALLTGGIGASVTFTPHVVPLARGMLVDAYAIFAEPIDVDAVRSAYERAYAASPFVRLLFDERAPSVAAVVGTNDAELRVDVQGSVVRAICAIDNLGKGAAGQAVQNLNIMLAMPEESGFGNRVVVA
ncbi:MAG TPA: N-acetyl-gamma-glutamyl-phosphate reductase [Candidatus Cybelea sp.]|jgi:N-acetyl-gamma-glutamyl-phosphate reductase